MRMRAPAYPLITIDPYFSIWSPADKLNDTDTVHWTNSPNVISGIAEIDGKEYRLIGAQNSDAIPAMKQVSANCNAFSTTYVFEENGVRLKLIFTSPIIPNDLYLLSRPVSYLEVIREKTDNKKHTVNVKISVSEQICMNLAGEDEVTTEELTLGKLNSVKMGTVSQKILARMGDDLRIDWGYFYLTTQGKTSVAKEEAGMTFVCAEAEVKQSAPALFTFAYDDIYSIEYFHTKLKSYWNRNGASITDEIVKAHSDYRATLRRCTEMADKMFADATRAGGEKYAELLELAFRQTIAAHKLAIDENGEVLFISKECFSNGCAATVDVSYPSIPLFLIYNPELVKGMMRPIYRYAVSDKWKNECKFDFAPHDAGRYPLVNGQLYGYDKEKDTLLYEKQMPVEECGNMLVMEAAVALATNDTSFANQHMELLEQWVKYLIENGRDPDNQLCTDDFAGHLAHNCNLSLKAIMGIASLGVIHRMNGNKREERKYMKMARDMAADWAARAANGDGSYRLAFDKEGSFSMKYNIVWDKLFGTEIMNKSIIESEVASYKRRMHPYGLPLDSRKPYTKSDWLVWTATLAENRADFEAFIEPMWKAFCYTPSRVPMTDWYYTLTGEHKLYKSRGYVTGRENDMVDKSFRNRTVQGGLFIKLLEYKGSMKVK